MTTYTYALSRTERVWLLFSVTLLASVLFYVMLAHWVVSDMNHPELMTYQQGFPLHLMIIGLFFIVTGLYVCRQTWSGNRWRKIA